MSTVSTISPYHDSSNEFAAEDKEYRKELKERFKKEERERRLQAMKQTSPLCVSIKINTPKTLIESAESIGFKLMPLEMTHISIDAQPKITLTKATGETLTIQKNNRGIMMETNKNISAIHNVMKKHNIDMATKYYKTKCRNFEVKQIQNGEVLIVGSESKAEQGDTAKITTYFKGDGTTIVDVSNVKGKRCEKIINEISNALGGESIKNSRKNEFFMTVEEKGRTHV